MLNIGARVVITSGMCLGITSGMCVVVTSGTLMHDDTRITGEQRTHAHAHYGLECTV